MTRDPVLTGSVAPIDPWRVVLDCGKRRLVIEASRVKRVMLGLVDTDAIRPSGNITDHLAWLMEDAHGEG